MEGDYTGNLPFDWQAGSHQGLQLAKAVDEWEKMAANWGGLMYMHMFAFRWKPGVTEEQKRRAVKEIRSLQGQIPGLLETAVGMNVSPRGGGYELGGAMKLADKGALESYERHPVHQKLLSWLTPLIEPIEVDFEIE
ncbi:MAG TPA: Dabb family protein [Candidatus Acidoferrum sp.]|jgi:hypothetical protein|nr:Dabb family protein [Candidatus Acidoferrum sp.]